MGLLDWIMRGRSVTWKHDHRADRFEISVERADGSRVVGRITALELAASRVPSIELAQRLFDHPLDRVAVGLAARRDWRIPGPARSLIVAGSRDLSQATDDLARRARERRPSLYGAHPASEDRAYGENFEKSMRSPREIRPALGPPNPRLPIYRPR
jgi:hypothetical protein